MSIIDLLYFGLFILAVACFYVFLRKDTTVNMLLPLFVFTLVVQVTAVILKMKDVNNLFLYHLHTPVEYLFYARLFYVNIKDVRFKHAIKSSTILVVVLAIVSAIFIEGIDKNNSYTSVLTGILTIGWCLIYYKELVENKEFVAFANIPLFWISTGLLFNNISNVFIIGSLNLLLRTGHPLTSFVYSFSYIFLYLFSISIILAAANYRRSNQIANEQ